MRVAREVISMLAIGLSIVVLVGLWFVIAKLTGHRLGKGCVIGRRCCTGVNWDFFNHVFFDADLISNLAENVKMRSG
jgi:hypothetical protein